MGRGAGAWVRGCLLMHRQTRSVQPGVRGPLHNRRVLELKRRKVWYLRKCKAEHQFLNQQLQLLSTAFLATPCWWWKWFREYFAIQRSPLKGESRALFAFNCRAKAFLHTGFRALEKLNSLISSREILTFLYYHFIQQICEWSICAE